MYVFSGKNSEKTRSEHLYNIVEIVKIAMKVENEALIKFGLTFADVYKEKLKKKGICHGSGVQFRRKKRPKESEIQKRYDDLLR